MLYVHRLMGDGAPGEVDPKRADARRAARSTATVRRDAERYAGPVQRPRHAARQAGRGPRGRGRGPGARRRRPRRAGRRRRARRHRRRAALPATVSTGDERDRDGQAHADRPERGAHARASARRGLAGGRRRSLYVPDQARRRRATRSGSSRPRRTSARVEASAPVKARAAGRHADQRAVGRARLRDHRHGQGQRARRADRDRAGRALRPVPGARQDHLHRRAGVDRHASSADARRRATSPRRSSSSVARLLHLPRVDRRQRDRSPACRPRARRRRRRP